MLTEWCPIPRTTSFSPSIRIPFWTSYMEEDLIKPFIQKLVEYENKVVANYDGMSRGAGTGLSNISMTTQHHTYNLFSWTEDPFMNQLKKEVTRAVRDMWDLKEGGPLPSIYGKCWANVLRKSEKINRHVHKTHEGSFLSGHVTLQHQNTSTMYEYVFFDHIVNRNANETGKITVFPSYVYHWTSVYECEIMPRITLGFDILLEEGLVIDPYASMYVHVII